MIRPGGYLTRTAKRPGGCGWGRSFSREPSRTRAFSRGHTREAGFSNSLEQFWYASRHQLLGCGISVDLHFDGSSYLFVRSTNFTARTGSSDLAKRLRCNERCSGECCPGAKFFLHASEDRYQFGDRLTFTTPRKHEIKRDEVIMFAKMDFTAKLGLFPMKTGFSAALVAFLGW